MVNRRNTLTAFGALVLGLFLAAPMRGSEVSLHTNNLTFSGPVRLPGVTLAAGTYIFERVEPTNADVVVVRSGDRMKVYFMASTQRVDRPVGLPRNLLVTLGEARPGIAPPITAWYPEGQRMGHAFIYETR
jgi:hypothetical protein